jgi:ATP-dependent Clp protease adaptor protein ClpS
MVSTMAATDVQESTKSKIKLKEPSRWKVIMLNDDYTPMDFVTSLLTTVFKHDEGTANSLMIEIHTQGSAVVGLYNFEIAEAKSVESTTLARNQGFPLQIRIEVD